MYKKVAYITDIHLDEKYPIDQGVNSRNNWKKILSDISSKKIDEIIFGGDIGERTANKYFFESLQNYALSISMGNHDYFDEVTKHFKQITTTNKNELYYSLEKNGVNGYF